jgi:ABC-type polysaccharide/polyol phosphate export permease
VQHLVSNVLTFLFFLCPVVYPATTVPQRFRFLLELNPLAQLTEFYQLVLINGELPPQASFFYVCVTATLSLVIGCLVHERYREHFAESL